MDANSSRMELEGDHQTGKKELSETITLRPIELSDVDDLMVWFTDERVSQYCVWDTYTSKEQAIDYVKNMAIPHPWLRVICVNNRAIGTISVTPKSGNDQCRAELGYALGYSFWGKGIMKKAVDLVISTIFEEWPHLERLEAIVDVTNKGSQRVLDKSGFQREGVLRKDKMDESSSKSQSEADQVGKEESSKIITIRSLELTDVDDLMVWVPDERVTKYFLLDTCTSSKHQQAIDFINNWVIPHPWLKVICINNKAIGTISVTPNSGNDKCRAALGYILARSFWGGIMTTAVEMVISTIFEECPYLERLEAIVDVSNKGSQRVLQKAGFQREGV
ncbi:OLC1v1020009C1 [Oldenlandia corymbosa var. corymbosa]|uniref:OLC1v1020009C1 n=1 Tax=Oldenlandia corymbosa var. corymbosa TaxID=529605 RepID=A0AAV1EFG7_OLDCO|nr:OLC1v1020009C1 [Oldenlandia corymbosa var. corymbosa]